MALQLASGPWGWQSCPALHPGLAGHVSTSGPALHAGTPPLLSGAGSDKKHAAFLARFPGAERLGGGSAEGALASSTARAEVRPVPWLLKAGLRPDEAATQDENWCGVLQVRERAAALVRAGSRLSEDGTRGGELGGHGVPQQAEWLTWVSAA